MPKKTSKPKTTILEITQEDIKNGVRCARACPVALALKRETKENWVVGVETARMLRDELVYFDIPKDMNEFIFDYDCEYKIVEPTTFTIEIKRK